LFSLGLIVKQSFTNGAWVAQILARGVASAPGAFSNPCDDGYITLSYVVIIYTWTNSYKV